MRNLIRAIPVALSVAIFVSSCGWEGGKGNDGWCDYKSVISQSISAVSNFYKEGNDKEVTLVAVGGKVIALPKFYKKNSLSNGVSVYTQSVVPIDEVCARESNPLIGEMAVMALGQCHECDQEKMKKIAKLMRDVSFKDTDGTLVSSKLWVQTLKLDKGSEVDVYILVSVVNEDAVVLSGSSIDLIEAIAAPLMQRA